MHNRLIVALALVAAACAPAGALAQPYPAKPVKVVVGYTPGGSNDVLARVVGKHLQDTWKQSFIVENKPGASGQIGAEAGAKAPPDGYTLVVIPNDVLTVQPHMYSKFPFDPIADVQPIATLGTVPVALVVNANSPYKSVAELIAAAKAKPGVLNYASSGAGGPQHMSAEMFMLLTATKMVHVPYKGNAPAVTDLLGGQVDVLFSPINSALPHIKAGKLRALAVAGDARVAALPDVPTLSEAGVPGYKSEIWIGLFAPAKTPKDIVDKIAAEVARMQAQADVKAELNGQGIDPLTNSPEQLAALIKADSARWSKVIKETGLRAE
jgi:tripartite-type tricarboxylate transporter receptor subunit TctC